MQYPYIQRRFSIPLPRRANARRPITRLHRALDALEGGHDLPREQAHCPHDVGMRDAAEVEGRAEDVELIVRHRVSDARDALVRVAVDIAPGGEHPGEVVRRWIEIRPAPADRGELVVAQDRSLCDLAGALGILVDPHAQVDLAVAV